ncbi:hypothetical protein [Demequina globuliformis]|uniref:hypothetical protein n=1 Tax=Demequina globuliformis TaxID=676202 RepID=UPI000780D332|nr:hypothetical protein [Demequina globuliformis]
MTTPGLPVPRAGAWRVTATRTRASRAPQPSTDPIADPFPLDIDEAHTPHAAHPAPEHASNVAARRASIGVVGLEWGVKAAVLAAIIALVYSAISGNWFGAATDAVGSWYGEEVAPWIAVDVDDVRVPSGNFSTDSAVVRTGK